MRLSPWMAYWRGEGGRIELGEDEPYVSHKGTIEAQVYVPVIVVECLELGKITVESRNVFRPYAPECPNLQDFA